MVLGVGVCPGILDDCGDQTDESHPTWTARDLQKSFWWRIHGEFTSLHTVLYSFILTTSSTSTLEVDPKIQRNITLFSRDLINIIL